MDLPPFLQEVEADLKKRGLAIQEFPWQLVPETKSLYVARFFEWESIYVEARVSSREYVIYDPIVKRHIPKAV